MLSESEVLIQERFEIEEAGHDVDFDEDFAYTPWWCEASYLKPVLFCFVPFTKKPKLKDRQWTVLFLCCYCAFIAAYDWELFPLNLGAIEADLEIDSANIGLIWSVSRLGRLPALIFSVLGDIYGRRIILITAFSFYILTSFLTSFSQDFYSFAIFQFFASAFMAVQGNVCTTMILEEFDTDKRGWGIGVYNSLSALGGGLAVILFALFGGMNGGWRILYALSLLQLCFLRILIKKLPESLAWLKGNSETSQETSELASDDKLVRLRIEPLRSLFWAYPARIAACSFVSFLVGFSTTPADLYKVDYMRTIKGLTAPQISLTIILAGLLAFLSFAVAGKLSDRYGRRSFIVVFNAVAPIGTLCYYTAPGSWFILFYFIQLQAGFILSVVNSAYFGECFPTSYRSTAIGWMNLVNTLSGALAMVVEKHLFAVFKSHYTASAAMALVGLFSSCVVGFTLPETANLDLDVISPEK